MKDSKRNVAYQKSIEVSLKEFLPCEAGVTSVPKEIIMILQIIAHWIEQQAMNTWRYK